jgi:hypothetical protein
LIPIDFGGGPVAPNENTILTDYKIFSRPLYLYINTEIQSHDAGVDFLKFTKLYLKESVQNAGYVPEQSYDFDFISE